MNVVDVAIDGDGFWDEGAGANPNDVREDGLGLVLDCEPLDKLRRGAAGAFADVFEAFRGEDSSFEAVGQEAANDVVGEEEHAAVGVVDDEELLGAEEFVADDEGTNGVVAGAATGVADDVSVAFGESGVFGWVETRVHTGEDGEAARWWECEVSFVAKTAGVRFVGGEDFSEDLAHGVGSWDWMGFKLSDYSACGSTVWIGRS
jgi:hypothetical protein